MSKGEYMLINMDWLSVNPQPNHCILVNSSAEIRCRNLNIASFPLTFGKSVIGGHNEKIKYEKCIIIELLGTLTGSTEYSLQIALDNSVENIKRFSSSA